MLEYRADDADEFFAGKGIELGECNHERRAEIHFIVFSASLSKAVTQSSRCSSFVSSILLWLMPWRLWTNIITVGHAGGGDFGGVVQRAGGEAMDFAAGFADGFVAQGDEFVVERARGDLPEAFPGNLHVAFLREFFAGGFGFLKHLGERGARRDGAGRG